MMYVHRSKNLEPYRKNVWRHVRRFWWVYPGKKGDDKNAIFEFHIETLLRRLNLEFAWRFHVGSKASETPWDGHVKIFGQALYWGFSRGRRLAHFLTSRRGGYHGRDLSVAIWERTLRWSIWVDSNDASIYRDKKKRNGKRRKNWRYSSISLDPRVWIWGDRRYIYEDLDRWVGHVDFEEDQYPVILTVQRVMQGRDRSKKKTEISRCVDVDAPRGIPTHFDKSGGWKGDRTFGWSIDWPYRGVHGEWFIDAKRLVEAWVLKERGRTGFRERQEQE